MYLWCQLWPTGRRDGFHRISIASDQKTDKRQAMVVVQEELNEARKRVFSQPAHSIKCNMKKV